MQEMFEYSFSPKANMRRTGVLIALCVLSCVLLGVASTEEHLLSPYLKCGSGLFLLLAAVFFVKLAGTRYLYRVTVDKRGEGELKIYELSGYFGKYANAKKTRTVCRLPLFDIKQVVAISDDREGKKRRKEERRRIRKGKYRVYNYCHDVFLSEYTLLLIDDGEETYYIKFAPNKKMLAILEK